MDTIDNYDDTGRRWPEKSLDRNVVFTDELAALVAPLIPPIPPPIDVSALGVSIGWLDGLGPVWSIQGPSDEDFRISSGIDRTLRLMAAFDTGGRSPEIALFPGIVGGGNVSISGGHYAAGQAGSAEVRGGSGVVGGFLIFQGGSGSGLGAGGSALLYAGNASGSGTGGSIHMRSGSSGSGTPGGIRLETTKLGFFSTLPTTKPTAVGSRAANAALASLITGLAGLGLITDGTTA